MVARGEVWWYEHPQAGRRPYLVVSGHRAEVPGAVGIDHPGEPRTHHCRQNRAKDGGNQVGGNDTNVYSQLTVAVPF